VFVGAYHFSFSEIEVFAGVADSRIQNRYVIRFRIPCCKKYAKWPRLFKHFKITNSKLVKINLMSWGINKQFGNSIINFLGELG
jgi:hypothetical protein